MKNVRYTCMDSPIGSLLLAGDGHLLSRIGFPSGKGAIKPKPEWVLDDSAFGDAKTQLRAYFNGTRQEFDLPLDLNGTTFQLEVWRELTKIPFGATISYGELARRIDRLSASRAVATVNGANPLPIVIPCHRGIGSNGSLTGFGGGLDTKRWLLALERTSSENDQPRLL